MVAAHSGALAAARHIPALSPDVLIAEYGDGWCGFNLTPEEAAAKIRKIEELLKANGRKRSDIEIAVSPFSKPITKDDLKQLQIVSDQLTLELP